MSGIGLVSLLALCALPQGSHASETHPWEWAGVFDLSAANYTWTFARGDSGAYADASIKFVMLSTGAASSSGIEYMEEPAETLYGGNATEIGNGASVTNGTYYQINMDTSSYLTIVKIEVATAGAYVFFLEHLPTEFEGSDHYFKDYDGEDAEPVAEEPESTTTSGSGLSKTEQMQLSVGATLVTCLPTLVVIVFFLFSIDGESKFIRFISAFGAGVIISAVVMHIYPEVFTIASDKLKEKNLGWKTGCVVVTGILTGFMLDLWSSLYEPDTKYRGAQEKSAADTKGGEAIPMNKVGASSTADVEGQAVAKVEDGPASLFDFSRAKPVVWVLLVGDLFHNVVDGITIGAAFKGCSKSMGWTMVGVVVAHELPQEVGDFFLLISNGLTVSQGFLFNVFVSLSALIGAIAIVAGDVTDLSKAYLLAYSAGVFLYSGMTAVLPMIIKNRSASDALQVFFYFCMGVIVIGLSMMTHDHCTPTADASHAGHNH